MQDNKNLAGSVVEREFAPPPPIKKRNTNGFPQVHATKKKISIKKNIKKEAPEEDNFELMEDAVPDSENPNNKPLDEESPRFDFDGNEITNLKETDQTIMEGLHNHGDSPEKPGYAIYEIAILARSKNTSQRALALEMLFNILKKHPKKYEREVREMQFVLLIVSSLFPPTNLTIKSFAIDLIKEMLYTQYEDTFSIYPYPAIPPIKTMTLEFANYVNDLADAAKGNEELMNALSLLTPAKKFEVKSLENMKPSIPLFRLARSIYINWGTVFAKQQALESLTGDFELAKEAASVLSYFKDDSYNDELLEKLHPIVLSILLSRIDDVTKYEKYIKRVLEYCPDPFVLQFLASCSNYKLISKEIAKNAIKNAEFSPAFVTLSIYADIPIIIPELPKDEQKCWVERAKICGVVEYIIQTKDLKYFPSVLPCLYSFTNPAANVLIKTILGFNISDERPVDPYEIFERFSKINYDEIKSLLKVAHYFPIRYILPLFNRNDPQDISPLICEFLDNYPDPLPEDSLRPIDCSDYFERFLFDCFDIPSYQKFAYFCISPGAHPEVRQHFWTTCSRYLSRMNYPNCRKDVVEVQENDKEILASIFHVLKDSIYKENDILNIAVLQLSRYMEIHQGDVSGQVFFANCQMLQEVWKKRLFSFMDKK